jgi:hypothetical protein
MTSPVRVWKHDGTLQCGMGSEIPLEKMQKQLEEIIGSVGGAEKRILPLQIIAVCGHFTGRVNTYEISTEQYYLLKNGTPGDLGFELWIWPDDQKLVPSTAATYNLADTEANPGGQIPGRDLYGRKCRCYKEGDSITKDFDLERVNIVLNGDNRVIRVYLG